MRRGLVPDVVSPQPAFEPPARPQASENSVPDVFESTYELDEYVPFTDDLEAAAPGLRAEQTPSRFGPVTRVVALIAGLALVASVIGATAWFAWSVMASR